MSASSSTETLRFLKEYTSTIGIKVREDDKRLNAKSTIWEARLPDGTTTKYTVTLVNLPSKKAEKEGGKLEVVAETTHYQALRKDYFEKGALPVLTFTGIQYYIRGITKNMLGIESRHFTNLGKDLMKGGTLEEGWQDSVKAKLEKQVKNDFKSKVVYNEDDRKEALRTDGPRFVGVVRGAEKVDANDLEESALTDAVRDGAGLPKAPISKRAGKGLAKVTQSSTCRNISMVVLSGAIGFGLAYYSGASVQ
ncbi:MAG: hypothetical protein K1000chlam1_00680 [Candidatus Anoxychlamydiales bacterium]|nr:hypothetical protein [Candidatus Anoxychlamydiales bacterium]